MPQAWSDMVRFAMKHIVMGALAAVIAVAISVSLHFYGAHDLQGAFAMFAGFPGVLISAYSVQPNDVLLTAVNGFCYFLVFEGIVALKKKLAK
jgi:hypothetical protein